MAPGISEPGSTVYTVTHNIIRAHVKAYHTYNDHFRSHFNGMFVNSLFLWYRSFYNVRCMGIIGSNWFIYMPYYFFNSLLIWTCSCLNNVLLFFLNSLLKYLCNVLSITYNNRCLDHCWLWLLVFACMLNKWAQYTF